MGVIISFILLVRFSDPFLRLDEAASGQISSVDGQNAIAYLNGPVSVHIYTTGNDLNWLPAFAWRRNGVLNGVLPFCWTIGLDKGNDKRPSILSVGAASGGGRP